MSQIFETNGFTFHGKTVLFSYNQSPLVSLRCLKAQRNYFTLMQDLRATNELGTVMHLHNTDQECLS